MTVHLPVHWIQRLCELPESGMGYQNVVVRLRDGSAWTAIVYDAERFEWPADRPPIGPSDIVEIDLATREHLETGQCAPKTEIH